MRTPVSAWRVERTGACAVGDARRLELAKALALRPRVLLLDEVLAGLRPAEIEPALELIDSLRQEGLALMMVEHVIHAIAAVADDVVVLHHGEVLTAGKPEAVNPRPGDRRLPGQQVRQAHTRLPQRTPGAAAMTFALNEIDAGYERYRSCGG